jgi:hypothetical protein
MTRYGLLFQILKRFLKWIPASVRKAAWVTSQLQSKKKTSDLIGSLVRLIL